MQIASFRFAVAIAIAVREVNSMIGGMQVHPGQFPYVTSLWLVDKTCTGLYLNETHIITSASCPGHDTYPSVALNSGTTDPSTIIRAVPIRRMRLYQGNRAGMGNVNNIAVIELVTPILLSPTVQTISIGDVPQSGSHCQTVGWEVEEHGEFDAWRWADVQIIDRQRCEDMGMELSETEYGLIALTPNTRIVEVDIGGPIICNGNVVGMITAVSRNSQNAFVMTVLSDYNTWIHEPFQSN